MRATLTTLFGQMRVFVLFSTNPFAVGLLILSSTCVALCSEGDGDAKKPPEQKTGLEIEKLVQGLTSGTKATREESAQRLREIPGVLSPLRRALAKAEAREHREQLENLVDQIRSAHFRRRLFELAKRKADAPLDLLAELLLENRRYVTPAEWKTANELIIEISDHLCQDKKKKLRFPEETPPYPVFKDTVGKEVVISEFSWNRVIADKLSVDLQRVGRNFGGNFLVLSHPSSDRRKRGSWGEIILVRAQPNDKHRQEFGNMNGSFIFCDGDVDCESGRDCVLIATGKITYNESGNQPSSIVIPDAHQSKKLRLFSCADFGLELADKDSKLQVVAVSAGSIAEKSRLKRGDIIEEGGGKGPSLSNFRRQMRQAYAQETEIPLAIHRDGKKIGISVSFVD